MMLPDAGRSGGAAPASSVRFAALLAYVINPLLLPALLLGLVLGHFGAPTGEIGRVVALSLVFFGLIPFGYVLWLLRRRRVASIEVRDRTRRTRPFLVGIASSLAALLLLRATGATAVALVAALVACMAVNTLLLLLVNLRWKISVHTAALAGFVSMLLFIADTAWPGRTDEALLLQALPLHGLFLLLPLLMWARVHVGAHTPGQVVAGTLFGLALPYAELFLLLQAGLL